MRGVLVTLAMLVADAATVPGVTVPDAIVVATARGERRVPVVTHHGHPALAVAQLAQVLPVGVGVTTGWAEVAFGGRPFRFLLDAPVVVDGANVIPLAGGAYLEQEALYVPLQFLAEIVPQRFSEGYRWDPLAARFEERGLAPVVRVPASRTSEPRPANAWGLRESHLIVVDAGHGGTDPGTPARYFPRGVREKHVTLQISQLVAAELRRRGVEVRMTRTGDTLIALQDRAPICAEACDAFVSIHVDALDPGPGYTQVGGIHTYFVGAARTADAARVAALENEALRYDPGGRIPDDDPVWFIIRDLQTNEVLRESASLAALVQEHAAAVHPGRDRGVQQAPWVVLNMATRPAILVETGFGTNQADARFLTSTSGQRRLAIAIVDGITEYLRRYEAKTATEAGR